jgi:hypothetical protein
MQDIDQELAAVTHSMSRSVRTATGAGMRRGMRGRGRGRGLRQTRPPSRRQLRTMTMGQLTKYLWKTHQRGLGGVDVSGESRRISRELGRRGLTETQAAWNRLERQRRAPRNGIPEPQVTDAAAVTALAAQEEAAQRQRAAEQARQDEQPGPVEETGQETTVETTQQTSQETVEQSVPVDGEDSGRHARPEPQAEPLSPRDEMSPEVAGAVGALTALETVAAADELADAVDHRADELGVPQEADSGLDATESSADDLAEDGAPESATDAASFGSQGVDGDLGQALADEKTPGADGPGETKQADNEQSQQKADTVDQAAGAEL